jgi:hypothetical protein
MPVRSTAARVALTDIPQLVPVRRARALVRQAAYVAVYVTLTEHGTCGLLDTSKARVLRMLSCVDRGVWVSEFFGTLAIGRPEPLPPACTRCDPENLADLAADPN